MESNKISAPEVNGLTEEQERGLIGFLSVRKRFEKLRNNSVVALCLVFGSVVMLNQIEGSPVKTWQAVMIVASIVLGAISEAMRYFAVSAGKKHLLDLGLPIEFAQSVARINLRKMDKELAAKKS